MYDRKATRPADNGGDGGDPGDRGDRGDAAQPGDAQRALAEEPLPTLAESPVVKWLLILNIAVYLLDGMLPLRLYLANGATLVEGRLSYLGNFNIEMAMNRWQLWRLITYQFLHGPWYHIGMNMMALFAFGPLMEKWWGSRRFLVFYLLCGACGAWLMAVLAYTPLVSAVADPMNPAGWLVGASGSIFGLLIGVALVAPKEEVRLMIPPIWISVRRLAFVFGLISLGLLFLGKNAGGNAAHLGGALFGFVLVKRPWSLDWADPCAPKLDPPVEMPDEPQDTHDAGENDEPTDGPRGGAGA